MKKFSSVNAVLLAGLFVFGIVQFEQESTTVPTVSETAHNNFNTVNGVLGDESFIATFGRKPGPADSEDLRLVTHLSYVERLLRAQPVDHLSEELQQARGRNLDRLHEYWTAGVFPRNTVVPNHRNPIFIDGRGRICAVGYLFEQDLGRAAAERINNQYQTATIFEIDDPGLGAWLATSGLTQVEAAMIQPAYGPYISFGFDFTTSGPTVCGSNENPDAVVFASTPDVMMSGMERTAALFCADNEDDMYESIGFSSVFEPTRANRFAITYSGAVEDLYYMFMGFDVWRSANGPTEGRVVYSTDGGSSFDEMYTFSISAAPMSQFFDYLFPVMPDDDIIIAFEARGGDPSGSLYLDTVYSDVYYTPVELVSFNATIDGDVASLQWVTASETNNAGFEIQMRDERQTDFHTLGYVEGHGTTSEVQNYTYEAPSLRPGTYAFRLKQIDYDGAFEYSNEIEATVSVPGTHLLTRAHPNPFNPQAHFSLSVAQTQNVNVSVYDPLGRKVLNLFEGVLDGGSAHAFGLDGRGLATGLLIIRATGETFVASQSVTLVR